jgi:tRNA U55 pseudouridine synthase TruB
MQKYPPFSSCRVDGKLLFDWAKEGKLNEIKIPEKEVEVFSMVCLGIYLFALKYLITRQNLVSIEKMTLASLLQSIEEKIGNITSGEFRQEAILAKWRTLCGTHGEKELYVATVDAQVSHGTYIRSIAHELGT